MVKWLNIVILFGVCINCIPYVQKSRYQHLIRIAILTGLDSVKVSGFKNNEYLKDYTIRISDELPIFLKSKNNRIVVNNRLYYGDLEIKKINGKIWVINILDIEDYLKGVVPCELGKINTDLIESAKAQAIAARTYAYANLNKHENLGFDLYATIRDQAYGGIQAEDSLINIAISKTRNLVITYQDKPIDAKYHSTCGGMTADFNDAWSENSMPYLRSVECKFCNDSPHFRWRKEMNKKEFFKNLRKNLCQIGIVISDTELIKSLILRRNPRSKRVVEVNIITDKDEYKISAYNIRRLFGSEKDPDGMLKSNNFTIYCRDSMIVIEGRGFGHGVGMCQFGAMGMAKRGKNYKDILRHYYPKTKIVRF